ncbi:GDP-fucose protein O-fucosyltransferase protein [Dioscorea alata]|uniref:GDP-fucose protein O-fucosyltransferase protein n=2 Tax=Dioscorea alata TaxID=55571 RepID=A0ACB7TTD0_DIOAL|nr:GDP-fucose protein O-fucosyltransferase protein [Dioscorea alata]
MVGNVKTMPSSLKKNRYGRHSNVCSLPEKSVLVHGLKSDGGYCGAVTKGLECGKRHMVIWKHLRMLGFVLGLMASFFVLDSLMLSVIHHLSARSAGPSRKTMGVEDGGRGYIVEKTKAKMMYRRLDNLADKALLMNEVQNDENLLWEEPTGQASTWKPCANKTNSLDQGQAVNHTGFILVSANGGLNQQRVAVCNAVAVAVLLNATLVLPKFLYSSVWKDSSQFGDIYQEDYFINLLKDDVRIVKELPTHLNSLDIEAIGSQFTDMDIMKESKPIDFVKIVLPVLRRNGVVHFLGFGNRLAFDPLPYKLQRLRCKCNFHALKFVPQIQEVGSLLVQRIRRHSSVVSKLDAQLLGDHMPKAPTTNLDTSSQGPFKYLALHMRFETDMVAYSQCDFGGGEKEWNELQAYREIHFPTLVMRMKNESISPSELRMLGRCPLTPEEAALMLSALGFKSRTYIYLAGSHIYGGQSRMLPFTKLYPNLVTKEDLLTPSELAPFRNFSSRLAALDFIACATSDVFAMTDSGSQLSSLVSGYRVYHGDGQAPTLRPNKKRFAKILSENETISWDQFKDRVTKMIDEGHRVRSRRWGRSIYRQPRTPGCMCKDSS